RLLELRAPCGERAGEIGDQADFHHIGLRRPERRNERADDAQTCQPFLHHCSSPSGDLCGSICFVAVISVLTGASPRRLAHAMTGVAGTNPATTFWDALVALRRIVDLPGVLDHIDLSDVDVHELAVALLDLADIDVLHNLALRRVDHDRPARAVE